MTEVLQSRDFETKLENDKQSNSQYQNNNQISEDSESHNIALITESKENTLKRKNLQDILFNLENERTSKKFTSKTEKQKVIQAQDIVKLKQRKDSNVSDLLDTMTKIEQDLLQQLEKGKNLTPKNYDLQHLYTQHMNSTQKESNASFSNSFSARSQISTAASKQSYQTTKIIYSPKGIIPVAGIPKEVVKEYNYDIKETSVVGINDPINYSQKLSQHMSIDSTAQKKRPRSAQPSARQFQVYNRRNNYHLSKEQLIEQVQQKLYGECTFRPKVSELPLDESFKYKAEALSSKERWKRLQTPKQVTFVQREQQKLRQEQQMLMKECTFSPEISNQSRSLSLNRSFSHQSISERLFQEANLKQEQKERLRRRMRDISLQECTFQPSVTIKLTGNKAEKPPVFKRVQEIIREKQEYLTKLRTKKEQNDNMTFQPYVGAVSQQLALTKRELNDQKDLDITTRLVQDAKFKQQRFLQNFVAHQKAFQLQNNKDNQSNNLSNKITNSTLKNQIDKTAEKFLERQEKYEKSSKIKKEQLVEQNYQKFCSFTPKIDYNSKILAESSQVQEQLNLNNTTQTPQNKFEKLSKHDYDKREALKLQIREDYFNKFTYQPQIDLLSARLGRESSFISLANNQTIEKNKLAQQIDFEKKKEDCTFKPVINKKSKKAKGHYSNPEDAAFNIQQFQQNAKERRNEQRKKEEYEEIKECTFKPEFSPQVDLNKPVIVRGMGKFLENRQHVWKQKTQQLVREQKLFEIHKKWKKGQGYTTPQPFNIKQVDLQSKEKKKEFLIQQEAAECTFKPKTK